MIQQLSALTCPRCGGGLTPESPGIFVCSHCERRWEKEIVDNYEKIFETIETALREQRKADLAALARRRYEEAHKKYVSNEILETICGQILNLSPSDFYARFYLATCYEDYSLEEFLSSMDIEKHYYDIEDMLDYLIRGLQARWINAVSTLIENAYKSRDLGKYTLWRDRFEDMAEKVANGIFEPAVPRDIFIAYSSRDMKKVNELLYVLEEENGLSCFVAARNLRHGSGAVGNYQNAIQTALRNCKAVVFISSDHSRRVDCEAVNEIHFIKANLPDMWRIELLTDNYKGIPVERIFKKFFEGLEYCTSVNEVANRYFDMLEEENALEAKLKREAELLAKQKFEAEAELLAKQKAEEAYRKREETRRIEEERKRKEAEAAKKRTSEPSDLGLVIQNGVLIKYTGNDKSVVIPSGVTTIGDRAFLNCESITSISIPNSVTLIDKGAFVGCANLTDITIPNSVRVIGKEAFVGCKKLESITLSGGITYISDRVFASCPALKNISLPNSITSIGDSAFSNCSSLTYIELPDSVTFIHDGAFSCCTSLASINIPSSVIAMGALVFANCSILKTIYCKTPSQPVGWNGNWLGSCSAKVFWNKKTAEEQYASPIYDFEIEHSMLKKYRGNAENVLIPNSVTFICKWAFFNCKNLKSITIPKSVSFIDKWSFEICQSLTSITIPASVNFIGDEAFNSCNNLKVIYCEAAAQPNAWSKDWLKGCPAQVIWGYKK